MALTDQGWQIVPHTMIDLLAIPESDPTPIYRYRDGLYAADLLTAAVLELDLFTVLQEPMTEAALREELGLFERPCDVMLTLFAAMGLLERTATGLMLTELAQEHLVKGSPWCLAPYYASLRQRPVVLDMLKVLRTGKPANWGSFKTEASWSQAMETQEFADQFTAAMDCRGVYLGQGLAQAVALEASHRLLDIGGGSGIYSCVLASRFPALRCTVFEKKPVDRIAGDAIAKRGFSRRVEVTSGDFFAEPLPSGFDAHLFSNVLHDWEPPTVRDLLRKSFESLSPGGLLLIHDAHINAEKNGPLPVAAYSAMLMHSTEGKCYSLAELREYFTEIGFIQMTHTPTAADRSVVTARKPL